MPHPAYKVCRKCGQSKSLDNFPPDQRRRDGCQSYCRPCANSSWRKRSPYGLSPDEYAALIARGCAICGSTEDICADHDHKTGLVRDALCRLCNAGIGLLRDDAARCRAAADYLDKHHAIPIPPREGIVLRAVL